MKQVVDPMGQVFVLAPDCDATQLQLTAAEGYLLSRIDGTTPWRFLREMAGIPVDEADSCLSRWVEEGLLGTHDVERSCVVLVIVLGIKPCVGSSYRGYANLVQNTV